jgi:hypothetical protein
MPARDGLAITAGSEETMMIERQAGPGVHPRLPLAPPPGPMFNELLAEDETWTTASGHVIACDDMTTDHLWNVLGYCRWHIPEILGYAGVPDGIDPYRWLSEQPVIDRMITVLISRGQVTSADDAWLQLRAEGKVPWE